MIDGLQASQQGKLSGSFLYYHILYKTMGSGQTADILFLTQYRGVINCTQTERHQVIYLCSNAVFGFWVVSTGGKISLCVPIHMCTYMRVSVNTWVHRHVYNLDHIYVWVYVFVNMDVCIIVVVCGCIYSCVCLSTDVCIWIDMHIFVYACGFMYLW